MSRSNFDTPGLSIPQRILLILAGLKSITGFIAALATLFLLDVQINSQFPYWVYLLMESAFILVGGILVLGSQRDLRAIYLGGYYLCISAAFTYPGLHNLVVSGNASIQQASAFLIGIAVEAFGAYFLWLFAQDFPHTPISRKTDILFRLFLWSSVIIGSILFFASLMTALVPAVIRWYPILKDFNRSASEGVFWALPYALMLPVPVVIARRSRRASRAERSRARMFVGGLLASLVPVCLDILLEGLIPGYARLMKEHKEIEGFVVYSLIISAPLITTYSVLVHRTLEVRVVIRKTIQYAFARNTLVLLSLAPLALAFIFLYSHRQEKVIDLVRGRSLLVLLIVAAAGAFILRVRQPIVAFLDRRFFREQVDTQRVFSQFVEKTRSFRTIAELAQILTEDLNSIVHPRSIVVLTLDPSSRKLVSTTGDIWALPVSSSLIHAVLAEQAPFDVKSLSDESLQLSAEEKRWLSDGAFELLLTLAGTDDAILGLIALGPKKSDLPYSKMDRSLLSAVAASVSLSLENQILKTSPGGAETRNVIWDMEGSLSEKPANECPLCETVHAPIIQSCPKCGKDLVPAMIPYYFQDKFRFDRRLGRGGMGVVYRAEDLILDRFVAVKTLPVLSSHRLRQLRQEARAVAALSHPNLALIYGAETWREIPLLIFEYLDAGTLADRIPKGPIKFEDAISIGIALCDALILIHRSNVLHRDIKPSNIGFRSDGTPKLLDFGLARILTDANENQIPAPENLRTLLEKHTTKDRDVTRTSITTEGKLVGTLLYLSPETLLKGKVSAASDLWAFALSLYEAIAGKHPLEGRSVWETLDSVMAGEVEDIRKFRKDCPDVLADFFKAALAEDSSQRPVNASQMKNMLEEVRRALSH